jgi:hypothetical protein
MSGSEKRYALQVRAPGDEPPKLWTIGDKGSSVEPPSDEFRQAITEGKSHEEVIGLMRQRDLSIVWAVRVLTVLYKVGLADAKDAVTSHPAYRQIAAAAEPLHDELVEFMAKIAKDNRAGN